MNKELLKLLTDKLLQLSQERVDAARIGRDSEAVYAANMAVAMMWMDTVQLLMELERKT